MNIFVLAYFLLHRGLVTDFSEPPNLFSLAVNSPPSEMLKGSCGGGPEGDQWVGKWYVAREGGHLYIEPHGAGGATPIGGHHQHHHHHHHHPAHQHGVKIGVGGMNGVLQAVGTWWEGLKNTKFTGTHGPATTAANGHSRKLPGWNRIRKGTTGKEASRHVPVADFELVDGGNAGDGGHPTHRVEVSQDQRVSRAEKHYEDLAKRRSVF